MASDSLSSLGKLAYMIFPVKGPPTSSHSFHEAVLKRPRTHDLESKDPELHPKHLFDLCDLGHVVGLLVLLILLSVTGRGLPLCDARLTKARPQWPQMSRNLSFFFSCLDRDGFG